MQQASATRLRCDPTEYARKQQEKKDRAKELKEQRHKGVFNDDHTFAPKVNPREKGKAPSSREEDERPSPTMQRGGGSSQFDDIPIRPSKTLQASSRKEILGPEETPIQKKTTATTRGNSSRPNNNADHHANAGDQESDALDTLSRAYPKKAASRQPEDDTSYSPPAKLKPEHDSLYREVKRTTGHDLEDIPIAKLNGGGAAKAAKHTGPCLRNSSCGCPKCGGGGAVDSGSSSRPDPPVRRREPVSRAPSDQDSYGPQTNTSRSAYGSQSEMENSLTLLKSKLSRAKARTAPSNQASLYDDKPSHEPASKSARQPSSGYAAASSSSSSTNSRRPSQQQSPPPQKPAAQNVRSSQAAAPTRSKQPQSRHDEDERPAATNRRLPRHQEEEEESDIRAPPPISSGFADGEQPDEYADDVGEMEECDNCHRRFNVMSFAKHRKICEKVFSAQRKVFNMAAKRLEGTEAEKLLKEAGKKGGKKGAAARGDEKPIKAKAVDWKQQSNAFREAMRANRDIVQATKDGRPLPPMAPSAPDPSLIPCDYCGRRFNDKAADRHIAFCKEKAQRSGGGPPPKKAAAPAPAAKPSAAPARAPPPRKR